LGDRHRGRARDAHGDPGQSTGSYGPEQPRAGRGHDPRPRQPHARRRGAGARGRGPRPRGRGARPETCAPAGGEGRVRAFQRARLKVSPARAAMWRPMESEAVAPGEGALTTWTAPSVTLILKSSTREPSGLTAWARTPAPPRSMSGSRISGTSFWSDRTKAALLAER